MMKNSLTDLLKSVTDGGAEVGAVEGARVESLESVDEAAVEPMLVVEADGMIGGEHEGGPAIEAPNNMADVLDMADDAEPMMEGAMLPAHEPQAAMGMHELADYEARLASGEDVFELMAGRADDVVLTQPENDASRLRAMIRAMMREM